MTEKSFYDACIARGIPVQNHASDLYIPVTDETTNLLKAWGQRATTFVNQVEGGLWYDVPFAYGPWWEAKAAHSLTDAQKELIRKHGTPAEFAEAAAKALGEISVAEYETAVQKYAVEFAAAGEAKAVRS